MAVATQEITQPIVRRTFTVDQYHAMGEAGIVRQDDRIELILGEVLEMPPADRSLSIAGLGDSLTSRTITALTSEVDAVLTIPTKPEKKDE